MKKKVILAMSGGVDSSVSAWILCKMGYIVEGLFMKNWDNNCNITDDLLDTQSVCKQLDIPLHYVDFSKEYWEKVFLHFLNEYNNGNTPNPDILCNKEIKFKVFFDYAISNLEADFISTGHYARIKYDKNNRIFLYKAIDKKKDQTYFLHSVPLNVFRKTIFPLGKYYKIQVRNIAKKLGLLIYNKKDSMGICFIGKKKFRNFLAEYTLLKPGDIRDIYGKYIGKHEGLMFYTIGQRKGLNIGGMKGYKESPWYVAKKDLKTNTLFVVQDNNNPLLYSSTLICNKIHWLIYNYKFPMRCLAKIRNQQIDQDCIIHKNNNKYYINFLLPQRALCIGQYIVFYKNECCLGGSKIEKIIY